MMPQIEASLFLESNLSKSSGIVANRKLSYWVLAKILVLNVHWKKGKQREIKPLYNLRSDSNRRNRGNQAQITLHSYILSFMPLKINSSPNYPFRIFFFVEGQVGIKCTNFMGTPEIPRPAEIKRITSPLPSLQSVKIIVWKGLDVPEREGIILSKISETPPSMIQNLSLDFDHLPEILYFVWRRTFPLISNQSETMGKGKGWISPDWSPLFVIDVGW